MRSIIEYLFETVDKRKSLIDFIKDKANDNEINSLYNKYITFEGKKIIFDWLSNKNPKSIYGSHLSDFKKTVASACDEFGCWEGILNLALKQINNENISKNKSSFYKIDFNKDFSLDDIYNYYNELEIPKTFWERILVSESAGQPVVGKGEFLLMIISENANKKEGDIIINDVGVEVKYIGKNEANLGNNEKGNISPIFNFLSKILKKDIIEQTISSGTKINNENTTNIKEAIELLQTIDNETLENLLIDSLNNNQNKLGYYTDNKHTLKNNYNKIIKRTIKELKELKNIDNFDKFLKIFTTLYTILYCTEENAKYLCTTYKDNIFKFIKIDNDEDTFNNIINSTTFPFYQLRASSNKNFIQISYKKQN